MRKMNVSGPVLTLSTEVCHFGTDALFRDFVRRHLTDKQAMLEATIQRHRTTIASANASLAAKDSLIAHLQKQVGRTQAQAWIGREAERQID